MPDTIDPTDFLLDGTLPDPTPAELWVSDDHARLDERLGAFVLGLDDDSAPAEVRGVQVRGMDGPTVLAQLAAAEDPASIVETLLEELEPERAIIAISQLDAVLDHPIGPDFVEQFRAAIAGRRLTRFIGLTDRDGFARLRAAAWRFTAFFDVLDLDDGRPIEPVHPRLARRRHDQPGTLELVRCCFDLYRGDLLRQMGFAAPASLDAERRLWQNLSQQLYRRAADNPSALEYSAAAPASLKALPAAGSRRSRRRSGRGSGSQACS